MMATERASVRALLQVPMATVARFAPDGRVWRAFDHLLAVATVWRCSRWVDGWGHDAGDRRLPGAVAGGVTAIDAAAHVRALTPEGLALESPMAARCRPMAGRLDVVTAGRRRRRCAAWWRRAVRLAVGCRDGGDVGVAAMGLFALGWCWPGGGVAALGGWALGRAADAIVSRAAAAG